MALGRRAGEYIRRTLDRPSIDRHRWSLLLCDLFGIRTTKTRSPMSPLYLCDGLGLQTRAACVLVHRVSLENEARQAALHEGITKVERDMERLLRTLKEREQVRDEADLPSIRSQGRI